MPVKFAEFVITKPVRARGDLPVLQQVLPSAPSLSYSNPCLNSCSTPSATPYATLSLTEGDQECFGKDEVGQGALRTAPTEVCPWLSGRDACSFGLASTRTPVPTPYTAPTFSLLNPSSDPFLLKLLP